MFGLKTIRKDIEQLKEHRDYLVADLLALQQKQWRDNAQLIEQLKRNNTEPAE